MKGNKHEIGIPSFPRFVPFVNSLKLEMHLEVLEGPFPGRRVARNTAERTVHTEVAE